MKHITRNVLVGFCFLAFFQIFVSTSLAQPDAGLISSRNYFGIEVGVNDSWLAGASSNFFFPYNYAFSDDPANPSVLTMPFTDLGSGIGFHIAATLDLSLTDFFGVQAKIGYRKNSTGSTQKSQFDCPGTPDPVTGIVGPNDPNAVMENNYKLDLSYFAISAGLRLQFIPKSLYGIVGMEFSSLLSNSFSGYQKVISSNNDCQFLTIPSGTPMGTTSPVAEGKVDNYFNSSQLAAKLGIGTFIPLGNAGKWVLTPELNVGIPLMPFFDSQTETDYKTLGVTTPKLWYVSISIALKFPFGATSRSEMSSSSSSSSTQAESGTAHLKGRVTNAKTGDGVKANITVVDLNSNEVVAESKSNGNGDYDVKVKAPGKYSVTADADGYLFGTAYFEVDDQGRILRGNHDIKLSPSEASARTRLLIFFDFDKADLERSSYPELDRAVRLMQANPSMEVEIAGYTDSKGTDAYNHDLSHRRANTVRDYLIKKGISADRIAAKGYGKDSPISTNDTEEGRADNRRVEFVVIKR